LVGRGVGSGFAVGCEVTWLGDVPPEECCDAPVEPAGVGAATIATACAANEER
jgi:hypothetical protein